MKTERAKFSFFKTLFFCFQVYRKDGIDEAKQRFLHIWPLHLHKWCGWCYRRPIERYYNKIGITPVGQLMIDISSSNRNALFYYAYAIRHLTHIPGVKTLLSELAKVDRALDEEESHEGERRYHNLMVELHGCYFVHKCMKMVINDVEYGNHKILSPNRQGNKSCDISGTRRSGAFYFECKDSSTEILSGEPFHNVTMTTPLNSSQNRSWLEKRMQDADDKGADYLLAKIPLWSRFRGQKRNKEWMKDVFPDSTCINGNYFQIPINAKKYRCLKGFFILARKTALRVTFHSPKL